MPHYIILGNFTEQGIKNVRQVPKRDDEARRMIEKVGGKMQIFYTLGEYDFVAITEMPDDEAMIVRAHFLHCRISYNTRLFSN